MRSSSIFEPQRGITNAGRHGLRRSALSDGPRVHPRRRPRRPPRPDRCAGRRCAGLAGPAPDRSRRSNRRAGVPRCAQPPRLVRDESRRTAAGRRATSGPSTTSTPRSQRAPRSFRRAVGSSAAATTRTSSSAATRAPKRWIGLRPGIACGSSTRPATCASSTRRCSPTSTSTMCPKAVTSSATPPGRPTGLLREQAQLLLQPLVYPMPVDRVTRAIERANRALLAQGVTSVQEAGIGGGWIGRTPIELAAYQNARAEHVLDLRVTVMIAAAAMHALEAAEEDDIEFGLDLGMRTGFGDDHLRIGAMKIFADGSLIGRTAAMCDDVRRRRGRTRLFPDLARGTARNDRPRAPFGVAGSYPCHRRPRRRRGARHLRRRTGCASSVRSPAPHRTLRDHPSRGRRADCAARRDPGSAGPFRPRVGRRDARGDRRRTRGMVLSRRSPSWTPGSSCRPARTGPW